VERIDSSFSYTVPKTRKISESIGEEVLERLEIPINPRM
jgi:hypothetical protein